MLGEQQNDLCHTFASAQWLGSVFESIEQLAGSIWLCWSRILSEANVAWPVLRSAVLSRLKWRGSTKRENMCLCR